MMLVGYLGSVGGILLQKLAEVYQFLDLAGLDAGPWMDVGSFQNDPFLLADQKNVHGEVVFNIININVLHTIGILCVFA